MRNAITRQTLRSGLAVILFRDKKTGRYSEAGGASDPGESLEGCASRELYEESLGLFQIDVGQGESVYKYPLVLSSGYTAFVVPVRHRYGFRKSMYLQNKTLLGQAPDVPYSFQETDDMRRFFIADIYEQGILTCSSRETLSIGVPDVQNEVCYLSKRTACVLQKAFVNRIFVRHLEWNHLQCMSTRCHNADLTTYKTCASVRRQDASCTEMGKAEVEGSPSLEEAPPQQATD